MGIRLADENDFYGFRDGRRASSADDPWRQLWEPFTIKGRLTNSRR